MRAPAHVTGEHGLSHRRWRRGFPLRGSSEDGWRRYCRGPSHAGRPVRSGARRLCGSRGRVFPPARCRELFRRKDLVYRRFQCLVVFHLAAPILSSYRRSVNGSAVSASACGSRFCRRSLRQHRRVAAAPIRQNQAAEAGVGLRYPGSTRRDCSQPARAFLEALPRTDRADWCSPG